MSANRELRDSDGERGLCPHFVYLLDGAVDINVRPSRRPCSSAPECHAPPRSGAHKLAPRVAQRVQQAPAVLYRVVHVNHRLGHVLGVTRALASAEDCIAATHAPAHKCRELSSWAQVESSWPSLDHDAHPAARFERDAFRCAGGSQRVPCTSKISTTCDRPLLCCPPGGVKTAVNC